MPYRWRDTDNRNGAELTLWPHRSLPRQGFVVFIAITSIFLALPLLALLGTGVLWGILPFMLAVLGGIWWGLMRSYRDGQLTETLSLGPDLIRITRRDPDGTIRHWEANPFWATVYLYPSEGPVPQYLTLKSKGKEAELGAFLSEDERTLLCQELTTRLAAAVNTRSVPPQDP